MVANWNAEDRYFAELAAGLAGYGLGYDAATILSTRRGSGDLCRARQVAIYLTHVGFGISLARIAYAFGRDRSTAYYACKAIEDRRDDPAFDAWIAKLEESIKLLAPLRDAS